MSTWLQAAVAIYISSLRALIAAWLDASKTSCDDWVLPCIRTYLSITRRIKGSDVPDTLYTCGVEYIVETGRLLNTDGQIQERCKQDE